MYVSPECDIHSTLAHRVRPPAPPRPRQTTNLSYWIRTDTAETG
ncbi:MAG: hypothetical protein JWN68_1634, partial [Nocardioides sp.]|nr:hypothetical protein [Nocardioides sp.]